MVQELAYWTALQQIVNVIAITTEALRGYEVVMATALSMPTDQEVPADAVVEDTNARLDEISREILNGTARTCGSGVLLYMKNRQEGGEIAITLVANEGKRYVLSMEG